MSETHGWTDRLSDYLNGDLDAQERAALEAHLGECAECRDVLGDLRRVVAAAHEVRDLPESLPARDLWPGIAAELDAPAPAGTDPGEAGVITLPTPGGVVLRAPQLAAASVAIALVSSLATWWVGARRAEPGVGTAGVTAGEVFVANDDLAPAPAGLAGELRDLEEALARSSAQLDPDTRRILERNLGVIERAIEESRRALAVDPGNAFLTEHLERTYRRKLVYLREAARLANQAG